MTTIRTRPDITPADRLGLTLFLAAAFHAMLILGISFSTLGNNPEQKLINTLDITLVQTHTQNSPDNPDYLAQANQEGGGNTRERIRTRGPDSPPDDMPLEGTAEQSRPRANPKPQQDNSSAVLLAKKSDFNIDRAARNAESEQREQVSMAEIMKSSHEIVRQSSEVQPTWQAYSKEPDPQSLYARTKKHHETAYLLAWSRKVEKIGNLNYPDEARIRRLSGSLMLEVRLNPDGSLKQVVLLKSSNHKTLDDAAKRIVRLAAPFDKVPPTLLGKNPEYRFVRTWSFTSRNQMVSH